jgi:hypothetical protein
MYRSLRFWRVWPQEFNFELGQKWQWFFFFFFVYDVIINRAFWVWPNVPQSQAETLSNTQQHPAAPSSTCYVVRAALAEFGLHSGNIKLNTEDEERISIGTVVCIILPVQ